MALSSEEIMLKERIQHLLRFKKYPIARLVDDPTMQARLGRQINGEAAVPYTTLKLILLTFHDISADWLLMDEGSMFKADHLAPHVYNNNNVSGSSAGGDINVGTTIIPVQVQRLLDEKDAQIQDLRKDKELLQGLLASFTKK